MNFKMKIANCKLQIANGKMKEKRFFALAPCDLRLTA
jgi:hypothetical protein